MVGLRFRAVFAMAALLIFGRVGAHSQSAPPPLNMVPSAPDELGQVLNHFVWRRKGPQSLRDRVDGQLVHVGHTGCATGRASLLRPFHTVARRNDDPENRGRFDRAILLESRIAETDGTELIRPAGPRFKLRGPTPPITRINVLRSARVCARVCLTVNGVATRENYSRIGVENLCTPREAKYWRRPILLTADLIEKTSGRCPIDGAAMTPPGASACEWIGELWPATSAPAGNFPPISASCRIWPAWIARSSCSLFERRPLIPPRFRAGPLFPSGHRT